MNKYDYYTINKNLCLTYFLYQKLYFFISLFIISCESEEIRKPEENNENIHVPKITSVTKLTDDAVLQDVQIHLNEILGYKHSARLSYSFDYSQSEIVSYEGIEKKSIITPVNFSQNARSSGSYSYLVTTMDNNIPSSSYIITEGYSGDNLSSLKLSTPSFQNVSSINFGSSVTVKHSGTVDSNAWCFLEKSAECVGAVATQMTDGSILGSASFLGCGYFFAYCGTAIIVGCGTMGISHCI